MKRYSLNTLKNAFELGNTSSWVLAFESVGARSPNVKNLNLIDGKYCPAIDINYDEYSIYEETITLGPGAEIVIPVYCKGLPKTLAITLYDDHKHSFRKEIKRWVKEELNLVIGRAPSFNRLKEVSLLVHIYHFDKQGKAISTDSYYLLPTEALSRRGDQSFSSETLPITFNVIGTQ